MSETKAPAVVPNPSSRAVESIKTGLIIALVSGAIGFYEGAHVQPGSALAPTSAAAAAAQSPAPAQDPAVAPPK